MGGTSTSNQQTQQSQNSTTAPWQPTQGILQNIIGGINGVSAAPTAAQSGALSTLAQNAQGAQNYGTQATDLANGLMSGGGTAANTGILNNAYQDYQRQLNPIANQNNDPMQAPGMQQLLQTIQNDVGNSVNSQFAGAGRDLSGLNQQALARGISQGEAAPLLAQYNQNVANQTGAAGNLFGAAGTTASGVQALNQQGYQNQATGLDTALNGIPAAQNNQANQILAAASQQYNLPISQLAGILGLTLPIAGLGSQSTGTGTSNTQGSNTMSGAQQFATIATPITSMFRFGGGGK